MGRDRVDLLVVVLLVLLVTDGLRTFELELRDSNRAEGRGKSVLRFGIVVMRSLEVDPRKVLRVLVTGTRFFLVAPTPSVVGERLSTVVLGTLVDTGLTGEDAGV